MSSLIVVLNHLAHIVMSHCRAEVAAPTDTNPLNRIDATADARNRALANMAVATRDRPHLMSTVIVRVRLRASLRGCATRAK